jgi:hypothetical protein
MRSLLNVNYVTELTLVSAHQLVQIEIPRLLAKIRIRLSLLQQLVKFPVQQLARTLLRRKRLLKRILPPPRVALEPGHGGSQIFDRRGFHRLLMRKDRAQTGIDLQRRLAAGACNLKGFAGHANIIYLTEPDENSK